MQHYPSLFLELPDFVSVPLQDAAAKEMQSLFAPSDGFDSPFPSVPEYFSSDGEDHSWIKELPLFLHDFAPPAPVTPPATSLPAATLLSPILPQEYPPPEDPPPGYLPLEFPPPTAPSHTSPSSAFPPAPLPAPLDPFHYDQELAPGQNDDTSLETTHIGAEGNHLTLVEPDSFSGVPVFNTEVWNTDENTQNVTGSLIHDLKPPASQDDVGLQEGRSWTVTGPEDTADMAAALSAAYLDNLGQVGLSTPPFQTGDFFTNTTAQSAAMHEDQDWACQTVGFCLPVEPEGFVCSEPTDLPTPPWSAGRGSKKRPLEGDDDEHPTKRVAYRSGFIPRNRVPVLLPPPVGHRVSRRALSTSSQGAFHPPGQTSFVYQAPMPVHTSLAMHLPSQPAERPLKRARSYDDEVDPRPAKRPAVAPDARSQVMAGGLRLSMVQNPTYLPMHPPLVECPPKRARSHDDELDPRPAKRPVVAPDTWGQAARRAPQLSMLQGPTNFPVQLAERSLKRARSYDGEVDPRPAKRPAVGLGARAQMAGQALQLSMVQDPTYLPVHPPSAERPSKRAQSYDDEVDLRPTKRLEVGQNAWGQMAGPTPQLLMLQDPTYLPMQQLVERSLKRVRSYDGEVDPRRGKRTALDPDPHGQGAGQALGQRQEVDEQPLASTSCHHHMPPEGYYSIAEHDFASTPGWVPAGAQPPPPLRSSESEQEEGLELHTDQQSHNGGTVERKQGRPTSKKNEKKETRTQQRSAPCPVCGETKNREKDLDRHIKTKKGAAHAKHRKDNDIEEPRWRCIVCSELFNRDCSARRHCKNIHSNPKLCAPLPAEVGRED